MSDQPSLHGFGSAPERKLREVKVLVRDTSTEATVSKPIMLMQKGE